MLLQMGRIDQKMYKSFTPLLTYVLAKHNSNRAFRHIQLIWAKDHFQSQDTCKRACRNTHTQARMHVVILHLMNFVCTIETQNSFLEHWLQEGSSVSCLVQSSNKQTVINDCPKDLFIFQTSGLETKIKIHFFSHRPVMTFHTDLFFATASKCLFNIKQVRKLCC